MAKKFTKPCEAVIGGGKSACGRRIRILLTSTTNTTNTTTTPAAATVFYPFYVTVLPDPFSVSDASYAAVDIATKGATFAADVLKGAEMPAEMKLDKVTLFAAPDPSIAPVKPVFASTPSPTRTDTSITISANFTNTNGFFFVGVAANGTAKPTVD